MEDSGLRSLYQGGFRPQRGTTEQVFVLNHLVEAAKHQRQPLYCAFVDFRKAFDTVRHGHLWERLAAYGITGNILSCIQSLYAQSTVAVNVNGDLTDFIKVLVGVRQGDPLSPTLFGLFIELLDQYLSKAIGQQWRGQVPELEGIPLPLLLYADDLVLIASDPHTLQQQLDALVAFCADWDMSVNLVKTKIVVFSQRATQQHSWHLNQQPIEQVDSYKYLGVVFHQRHGLLQAGQQLAQSAHRAMYAMQGMCYSQDISDPSIRLHMWQQLVLPVVSYASEVWGPHTVHFTEPTYASSTPGEKVQAQFLRWYTGARPNTHHRILLQAANRLPLQQHWLQRSLQLWNKLAAAEPSSWVAHRAFKESIMLWQAGCNECWAARVLGHLQQLGILSETTEQPMWSRYFDPSRVEAAMDSITAAKWAAHQQPSYRALGSDHQPGRTLYCYAQYFMHINSSSDRRHVYHNTPASQWAPIMQLATGKLKLHSVTAHWQGRARSTTAMCPCCPTHLEDAAHYVLECPAYGDIRSRYPSIMSATQTAATSGVKQAMLALFTPQHFDELAGFLRQAYKRRFSLADNAHQQLLRSAAAWQQQLQFNSSPGGVLEQADRVADGCSDADSGDTTGSDDSDYSDDSGSRDGNTNQ